MAINNTGKKSQKITKKKKWIIIGIIVGILVVLIGAGVWKAESVTSQITTKGSLLGSISKTLPFADDGLKGSEEGRINIALLGMRGLGVAGGGELVDTIMVLSIVRDGDTPETATYKMGIVSVPRDLFVSVPDGSQGKINTMYFAGEKQEKGKGLEYAKQVLSEISGQTIHYAGVINFAGFEKIIDIMGGIEISLDEAFIEPVQFNEVHVCDGHNGGVFTQPTGEYEIKYLKNGKIRSKYPLCSNEQPECGGVFRLPAGTTQLTGEQALCYARSRMTSSDFERARRQQQVLDELRTKATSLGFLTDLSKINEILGALGENVQIDLEPWELQKFFDLYKELGDVEINSFVLENSEKGLLESPGEDPTYGYILKPRGGDYSQIHQLFLETEK